MHSVLGRGSFSINSSISEVWHGKRSACGTAEALFSLQLVWIVGSTVLIFLLKISHRFHLGFRSGMLTGLSSTVISWSANHLEVALALWAGAKVLLEKEISISIKLVSRWKHKVLQNLLGPHLSTVRMHRCVRNEGVRTVSRKVWDLPT